MIAQQVIESSQVSAARRFGVQEAQRLGFDETDAGRVALVVTELANNVVRHGSGGEMLIGPFANDGATGVGLIALDRGKGMVDLDACLRDGYSTGGTPGTGLGSVVRQSDLFDVYTQVGGGTAVFVALAARGAKLGLGQAPIDWGAVAIAKPGETVCGDAWSVVFGADWSSLLVTDGLGHGQDAAKASAAILAAFEAARDLKPAPLIKRLHQAAAPTRGAAAAVARLEFDAGCVRYAGVGNITGTIVTGGATRKAVSHNGILGHAMRRVQEFAYPFAGDLTVVLHSDGIQTSWSLDKYPGLVARHPALIAAILYRDFNRGRDDATVLVARWRRP